MVDSCAQLNQKLNDPAVRDATAAVASARQALQNEFNAIDQSVAKQKAQNDMAFVSRTIKTLFHDLNLYSIGHIAVLDRAAIGPAAPGGSRLGQGAGVRLELANSVSFNLGYAWNVDYQPGEGKGALIFAIKVRDFFH